ncbi:MAG: hypothetical protein FGM22_08350 [Burkholderiaceae bacterium]|nr:hypothetical protein [Burkholderiaceae bacterium]
MKTKKWAHIERDIRSTEHAKVVAGLESQLAHYRDQVADLEGRLAVALQLSKSKPRPRAFGIPESDRSEAVAVALASDWHVEETVEGVSVNGLNEFNLAIADERIAKFFRGVSRLTEIERHGADISTCLLWLGGDLMTGFIHEELAETNGLTPTQTILWLQDRLLAGIEALAADFENLLVVTSYGNHGRTTKKPRHATGAANSYEWMLYRLLEGRTAHLPHVQWQVGESYHNIVEVYGRTIRFHHGDGLKYQGGIGGLTIPVEKAIASWNKSPIKADLDVFGHWHTQMQSPKFCANGSLIGYNAYAISIKAAYEPPQQTFFLFDRARGRTMTTPITL